MAKSTIAWKRTECFWSTGIDLLVVNGNLSSKPFISTGLHAISAGNGSGCFAQVAAGGLRLFTAQGDFSYVGIATDFLMALSKSHVLLDYCGERGKSKNGWGSMIRWIGRP